MNYSPKDVEIMYHNEIYARTHWDKVHVTDEDKRNIRIQLYHFVKDNPRFSKLNKEEFIDNPIPKFQLI